MVCPYKSRTVYTKNTATGVGGQVAPRRCSPKEASEVLYDFGDCDKEDCPFYQNGACRKVEKELSK